MSLPLPSVGEDLQADYATVGTTLGPHPLGLLRGQLSARRCRSSRELVAVEHGHNVSVAGLVVWHDLAERQRRVLVESQLLQVDGHLGAKDGVRHLIAGRLRDLTSLLAGLSVRSGTFCFRVLLYA